MSSSDQIEVYIVAGIFVCVGLAKVFRYNRSPKALGAKQSHIPFGLSSGSVVAIGLFEIAAALALVMPSSFLPQVALTQVAIAGLALLTATAVVYHALRRESTVPNLMLFLLVLFVVVVRWV